MKSAKLGAMFLISILALAGIGMGYAAWTDTITIDGTVNTGSVDLLVVGYSGTWVWKIWETGYTDEIYVTNDPDWVPMDFDGDGIDEFLPDPVASAWAEQATDASGPIDDAVKVTFDSLFPCITFEADILFHYVGSIPVKISATTIDFHEDTSDPELTALWYSGAAGIDWYWSNADGDKLELIPGYPIGIQLHNCDYIMAVGYIHLPQESELMNKQSSFTATFDVIQWNEY